MEISKILSNLYLKIKEMFFNVPNGSNYVLLCEINKYVGHLYAFISKRSYC